MPLHMLIPNNPSSHLHRPGQVADDADVHIIEVPFADEPDEIPQPLVNGRTRIMNAAVDPSV